MSHLVLTVCDHLDQEFYELGRVELEVPAEVLIERLPKDSPHVCDDNNACLILDYWPSETTGIDDDREISPEVAEQLMPDYRKRWLRAREALCSFYAEQRVA